MFTINGNNYDIKTNKDFIINQTYKFNIIPVTDNDKKILSSLIDKLPLHDFENNRIIFKKLSLIDYRNKEHLAELPEIFNMDVLKERYYKNVVATSNFKKPSFIPWVKHIAPLYTKRELYFKFLISKNQIELFSDSYEKDINQVYRHVSRIDYTQKPVINAYKYILDSLKLQFLSEYTLFGSHELNDPLRLKAPCNSVTLKACKTMLKCIMNAPLIEKDIIVYRFVKDDSYLEELRAGDYYIPDSFLSTSREPFKNQQNLFGNISLVIHIPKNTPCLFLELASMYPEETELVLPPNTKLLLENVTGDVTYFLQNTLGKVSRQYTFRLTEILPTTFDHMSLSKIPILDINYLKKLIQLEEKIKFMKWFKNDTNTSFFHIDDELYKILEYNNTESSIAKFFKAKSNDGIGIATIDKKRLTIRTFIEIHNNALHVNYMLRFLKNPSICHDDLLFKHIRSVSKLLGCSKCKIYANFIPVTNLVNSLKGNHFVFNMDLYNFLFFNIKRFSNNHLVTCSMKYFQIEEQFNTPAGAFVESFTCRVFDPSITLAQLWKELLFGYPEFADDVIDFVKLKMKKEYNIRDWDFYYKVDFQYI